MNIAVVGSRTFDNYALLKSVLDNYHIATIVSGGASGADSLAQQYAQEKGILIKVYPADWKKYGRAAGAIRNKEIVHTADYIFAFWDQRSPGTKNCLEFANKHNKPYTIIPF